jgi:hypothetical protein
MKTCLNCERSENEVPLILLSFRGIEKSICPQCMPVIIHKPQNLVEKLPGFEPPSVEEHTH